LPTPGAAPTKIFSRPVELCRGHRIVAGDHDGADAHAAQLGEALADAALDDVLEVNDTEQPAILGHRQRGAAGFCDRLGDGVDLARHVGAHRRLQRPHRTRGGDRGRGPVQVIEDRVDRALAHAGPADLDAAHPALGGEWDEIGAQLGEVAAANAVFLLRQHHDRAALRRLVGK
jgi:hypothetical protein